MAQNENENCKYEQENRHLSYFKGMIDRIQWQDVTASF